MKLDINYIMHHKNVNLKMSNDTLSCIDVSIYNALFLLWNISDFDSDLSINRNDVMKLAKVGNANVYTKSLKTLHDKKYIYYSPSYNPLIGSKVSIIRFDKGTAKGIGKASDIRSVNGGDICADTLYKQENLETNKPLNKYNDVLEYLETLKNEELEFFLKNYKNIKPESKFNFKKSLLDLGIKENLVNDWILVREKLKAINTETSFLKIKNQLLKITDGDINSGIEMAIENSWKGFEYEWYLNKKNNLFNNGTNKGFNQKTADRAKDRIGFESIKD